MCGLSLLPLHSYSSGKTDQDCGQYLHMDDVFSQIHHDRAGLPPNKGFTVPGLCEQHSAGIPPTLKWRAYDRAFRLQAGGKPEIDWATIKLPLYAKMFTMQSRHRKFCRYCYSLDHQSSQCLRGVDVPISSSLGSASMCPRTSKGDPPPICTSWNSGACKFPTSCNYRHLCSSCFSADHRSGECPSWSARWRVPGNHPEGQRKPWTEDPASGR